MYYWSTNTTCTILEAGYYWCNDDTCKQWVYTVVVNAYNATVRSWVRSQTTHLRSVWLAVLASLAVSPLCVSVSFYCISFHFHMTITFDLTGRDKCIVYNVPLCSGHAAPWKIFLTFWTSVTYPRSLTKNCRLFISDLFRRQASMYRPCITAGMHFALNKL